MFSKRKYVILLALIITALAAGNWAKTKIKQGGQAYTYGYPMLLVEATKNATLQSDAELNHFTHNRIFPDHNFRGVVRPNDDTLYSVAWLDLSSEALVLSVPDTQDRYYVMPFMDAFTNVFATVGKRETGTRAGRYLISGPEWSGKIPATLKHIKAPTNLIWLIGRIQTNGADDIPAVGALQSQFALATLGDFLDNKRNESVSKLEITSASKLNPNIEIEALSTEDFLANLGRLVKATNMPTQDKAALDNLRKLGISQAHGFDPNNINRLDLWLFEKGFSIAKKRLEDQVNHRKPTANGWLVLRKGIGNYGTNYAMRAAVAKIGLGALPPEEASYPSIGIDSEKRALNGRHSYQLHFAAGELPPANAFWSLAMYDRDGFFSGNAINRYSIGDRDNLLLNKDGSLTILIQHEQPSNDQVNWLPSAKDEFSVMLRLYLPGKKFITGDWVLPPITRVKQTN